MTDPSAGRAKRRQDPARGKFLQSMSIVLGVVGGFFLLIFAGAADVKAGEGLGSVLLGVAALALFTVCSVMYDTGRRHLQAPARAAMADDRRPPVVYLRSFDTEYKTSIEEEVLAKILREVGPFVAIGRPEDKLPPLGAAREYLPKGPWKPAVRDLLDEARMVVLVSGETEGLAWEMQEVVKRVVPARVVALVTDDPAAYDSFRSIATAAGGLSLPAFPPASDHRHKAGQFTGLIRFDANWRGRFVGFEKAAWVGKGHEMTDRETGLENRLRLALAETEVGRTTIAKPTTNWLKIGFVTYLVLMLVAGLIVGTLGMLGAFGE